MKILLAEDDRDLSRAVKALLEHNGYTVDTAADGEQAIALAECGGYEGLILDWMMPARDGIEVLKHLRGQGIQVPCLMLTARDAVEDRVTGLDAGADDYLPKPFSTAELLARVRALVRRRGNQMPELIRFEDLELNTGTMELECSGKKIRLTGKAFQMMRLLMENPGVLLSVQQMMDRVWGWDTDAEINVVWVNISALRKRLSELGSRAEIRVTRGAGYSLEKRHD